MCQFICASR
jgi:transposase InsO family protein